MYHGDRIPLDPLIRCSDAVEFESELRRRVVGQEEAIAKTTEVIQKFMAGLNDSNRPVGNILLLGPTGTGKTKLVEAVCEVMFGDIRGMVRIDCAEFRQGHETAKILGAPPGYVGHKENGQGQQITQEKLDKTHNEHVKLSVLLLDEIEKAHENFWELLLGILDKGRLTDNQGKVVDLTRTIIFMTSNLGAREVIETMEGSIGFGMLTEPSADKLKKISENAAAKKFSPEFMNRLDQVITFQHLTTDGLKVVLEIELGYIQKRILEARQSVNFVVTYSDEVKSFLLQKGYDKRYGARFLKRTLEKYIVNPLVGLMLTAQIEDADLVEVTMLSNEFKFHRIPADVIAESSDEEFRDFRKAIDE